MNNSSGKHLPYTPDWETLGEWLPGFDLSGVRTMLGGNAGLYLQMLAQFHAEYLEESVNIIFALALDKSSDAERLLHKLKGVSGSLGATLLNEACERLDAQLKLGKYGELEFERWRAVLDRTMDAIGNMLSQFLPDFPKPGLNKDPEFGGMLAELESVLASDGPVIHALLQAMQPHIKPAEYQLYHTLVKHVAMPDYPKARSTLKTLIYLYQAIEQN
jgi:HPt (histidine-containing phosphotransfer) domain-containing protein